MTVSGIDIIGTMSPIVPNIETDLSDPVMTTELPMFMEFDETDTTMFNRVTPILIEQTIHELTTEKGEDGMYLKWCGSCNACTFM